MRKISKRAHRNAQPTHSLLQCVHILHYVNNLACTLRTTAHTHTCSGNECEKATDTNPNTERKRERESLNWTNQVAQKVERKNVSSRGSRSNTQTTTITITSCNQQHTQKKNRIETEQIGSLLSIFGSISREYCKRQCFFFINSFSLRLCELIKFF